MAFWPWRKRSKTNSGGKRPANTQNESRTDLEFNPRPRTPSIRSVSMFKRRTGKMGSLKRSASRKASAIAKFGQSSASAPSGLREVTMSSPSPTQTPIAQLQTPVQTPPPSQHTFTPPRAPENRRSDSTASSHRPRKRNLLRKAQTFDESQRAPSSSYPSPPPDKNNPHLFRAFSTKHGSLRRTDSKFRPFSRRQLPQFDRPLSELSMRSQESIPSIMSVESRSSPLRAFKVRSLDVLSPRPTLRFSSNSFSRSQGKMPDYPSNHERKTSKSGWKADTQSPIVEEPPPLKRNRVYGLADELDSKGIREALERDARRREKKAKEDEEKAQIKLEIKAARQKAEEEQAMLAFKRQTIEVRPETNGSNVFTPPAPIKTDAASSVHSPHTGTHTPMSWLHGPSQENLTLAPKNGLAAPERPGSMGATSYRSEPEDPIVETATAVRLSGYSAISPPPSPGMTRTPKIVDHSPSHSRKMSRDQAAETIPDAEESEENRALANAWTSFFKKATAARVQKEHEAQQEAWRDRNGSLAERRDSYDESISNRRQSDTLTGMGGSLVMPGTFLQSPTPRSARSRVPSEQFIPENFPAPPKQTQPAIPVPHEPLEDDLREETVRRVPLSPIRIATSPLSKNFSDARRPSSRTPTNMSPRGTQTDLTEKFIYANSGRNSASHERIRSMASIDLEGSWLSGRLNSRQSVNRIPSIRDSAASLKIQYHDLKVNEDRRASIADDQYFTGVQDVESSDEEERDILRSYMDDDISLQRSSLTSPPHPYRSPPRSPTYEEHEDNDSDTDPSGDQYLWREGLGRRPTITRVDSNFVRKREEMGSVYDASSMETADYSHVAMAGELVMEDSDGNIIVPDRVRDSPSPTLGKTSPRFVTPKEYLNGTDPFLSAVGRGESSHAR